MGAERGEQPTRVHAMDLHAPPEETAPEEAGAPPGGWRLNLEPRRPEAGGSTWKLVELRLWMKLPTPEVTP